MTRRLQLFPVVRRVEAVRVEQLGKGFDNVESPSVAEVGESRLELVKLSARLDDELLRLLLVIAKSGAESVVERLEAMDSLDEVGEGLVEDAEQVRARFRKEGDDLLDVLLVAAGGGTSAEEPMYIENPIRDSRVVQVVFEVRIDLYNGCL